MAISTNVPEPSFTNSGFVAPLESAILTGVLADINTAFGGNLNTGLTTPQGQLAQSMAAIIGDKNDKFLALANGVDPAFASGRMQDAIARIYFLTRQAATSTVVTCTCTGLYNTKITAGAIAVDTSGYTYLCNTGGTIPLSGSISLEFSNSQTGPIPCAPLSLSKIYQAIPGWDSIINTNAGSLGQYVESRADFEYRREQTVAKNGAGSLPNIVGALFALDEPDGYEITDVYGIENPLPINSGDYVYGSISGTTLTITSCSTGNIAPGQMVIGNGITAGTVINSTSASLPLIPANVTVGSPVTFNVNISQTVGPIYFTTAIGGVALTPNSIMVSVYGGVPKDIAQTIWYRKSPGCNYNGNTTVSISDTSYPYTYPYPTYNVTFNVPSSVTILFQINMQAGPNSPSNAVALIQAAVLSSFNGTDGGARARIGSVIHASRFYAGIAALGSWAIIQSIQVGITSANQNSVAIRVDQVPVTAISNITVSFV